MTFQFQSGTIKGSRKALQDWHQAIFQFQSGTIKGYLQRRGRLGCHGFQFQSGTIKGAKLGNNWHRELRYFNSNLVRLKVLTDWQNASEQWQFQFQSGTIKGRRKNGLFGAIQGFFTRFSKQKVVESK